MRGIRALRYRCEFAPQRESCVVYARGSYINEEDRAESGAGLVRDAIDLRDSDQVLAKLRLWL